MAQVTIREGLDGASVPDSWIRSAAPGQNNGTNTLLYIGWKSFLSQTYRSVLLFDLGVIPPGAAIDAAKLTVYVDTASAYPENATVNRVTATWNEAAVTWNDRYIGTPWTNPGGDYTTTGWVGFRLPTSTGDFDITGLKALVEDAIANRNDSLDVLLKRSSEEFTTSFLKVASGEEATASRRPRLIVDYTSAAKGVFVPEGIHSAGFGGRIVR